MGYGKKIFQEAMDQLEARKRAAEEAAWQRQRDFAARCPRAGEIKWEMAQNASQIARAALFFRHAPGMSHGSHALPDLRMLRRSGQ